EAVAGVDATDLLVNGAAATNLTVLGVGRYRFAFPQPPTGVVQVAWSGTHGIRDFAPAPNAFAGGAWTYTLNPMLGVPQIRITEFLAANVSGLRDEDGEAEDWVEIHNFGGTLVNLAGYSLTDD